MTKNHHKIGWILKTHKEIDEKTLIQQLERGKAKMESNNNTRINDQSNKSK